MKTVIKVLLAAVCVYLLVVFIPGFIKPPGEEESPGTSASTTEEIAPPGDLSAVAPVNVEGDESAPDANADQSATGDESEITQVANPEATTEETSANGTEAAPEPLSQDTSTDVTQNPDTETQPGLGESADDLAGRITAEQEADINDRAFPLLAAKWTVENIFVCWEDTPDDQQDQREVVRKAVEETWAAASKLSFLGWNKCHSRSGGIRIAVADKGPHVKRLGKFIDGIKHGMVLNFTYKNWGRSCQEKIAECTRIIAVHEFGHAIGFAHEQNRPDTPDACFGNTQGSQGDNTELTPWDPDSVMNYCNPVYGNNGVLSHFDKLATRHIYGEG